MVKELISQDFRNAFEKVERHRFVDSALASRAYEDTALPIGYKQTISQPCLLYTSDAADE